MSVLNIQHIVPAAAAAPASANVTALTTTPTSPAVPLVFAPIPLLSGNAVLDTEGNQHRVTEVTVHICTDAASVDVVLEHRFGGWWAPAGALTVATAAPVAAPAAAATAGPSGPALPLVFPPIPLLSGDTVTDDVGAQRPVTSVTALIRTAAATPVEVALEHRFGGWWAPAGASVALQGQR